MQVQGPPASAAEVLAARTRTAALHVAAVHRQARRLEEPRLWSTRTRRILKDGRTARRGRSVRATSAGLRTLGRRP
ncbi:hypothetical protein [Streptomyces sp. NPDC101455]|uniref:hypothetical protein n=1 Tax=Streptomyces sp. NPDC101455 TaxID=3366142 RepID=UPI0037FFBDB7